MSDERCLGPAWQWRIFYGRPRERFTDGATAFQA